MSFEKPNLNKFDRDESETKSLMCQEPGCKSRWSVNMGWRKCSQHAWGKSSDFGLSAPSKVVFTQPPVRPYTEVDDEIY
jgi:hypothetical protein